MSVAPSSSHSSVQKKRLLICDDSSVQRLALQKFLGDLYQCVATKDADEATGLLKSQVFDLLLLDISMRSEREGLEYLPQLRADNPELGIVISSNHSGYEFVRQALLSGADDFVPKAAGIDEVRLALQRALNLRHLKHKSIQKSRELKRVLREKTLIGQSPAMEQLRRTIEKVKQSSVNVIVHGESGTGKELVAQALRGVDEDGSPRPFVAVDSSTIQSTMAESLLFGHEKGAFTGADRARAGLFEEADGGIIYFDEISNMPLEIQRKLLRVVQEKQVSRLGSHQVRTLDFRVVCATNQDLQSLVDQGRFQFDLLHRLGVVVIEVPPLRERKEDIPLLVEHYLQSKGVDRELTLSPELEPFLMDYDWPGNVRELFNLLAYLTTMCEDSTAVVGDLPPRMLEQMKTAGGNVPRMTVNGRLGSVFSTSYQESVKNFEREFMIHAYVQSGRKIARMARDIGLDRSYLYAKLKNLGLFPIEKLKELSQ